MSAHNHDLYNQPVSDTPSTISDLWSLTFCFKTISGLMSEQSVECWLNQVLLYSFVILVFSCFQLRNLDTSYRLFSDYRSVYDRPLANMHKAMFWLFHNREVNWNLIYLTKENIPNIWIFYNIFMTSLRN